MLRLEQEKNLRTKNLSHARVTVAAPFPPPCGRRIATTTSPHQRSLSIPSPQNHTRAQSFRVGLAAIVRVTRAELACLIQQFLSPRRTADTRSPRRASVWPSPRAAASVRGWCFPISCVQPSSTSIVQIGVRHDDSKHETIV